MLDQKIKDYQFEKSSKNLKLKHLDWNLFVRCIVTGDETLICHYDPETKPQNMQWKHVSSPSPLPLTCAYDQIDTENKTVIVSFTFIAGISRLCANQVVTASMIRSVKGKHMCVDVTGISGWYAVNAESRGWERDDQPTEQRRHSKPLRRLDHVVGGVELTVKFAHNDDRNRIIHAARSVGWASVHDIEYRDSCEAG